MNKLIKNLFLVALTLLATTAVAQQGMDWRQIRTNTKTTIIGLQVFGDSISNGTGASTSTKGFAFLLQPLWAGKYLNYSKPGDQILDQGLRKITPAADGLFDYSVELGTNDVTTYNSSANLQKVYQRLYLHGILWPSIANIATFAQSCTKTSGTWTNDSTLRQGLEVTSTTNGSVLTCSVAAPKASDTLYIGYHIFNGGGGTFTVTVDGSAITDPISSSTTFVNQGDGGATITSANSNTSGIAAIRVPSYSKATHSVVFTVTSATSVSNQVTIDYVAFAPTTAPNPHGYAVSLNQQNNANNSLVPTYNTFITNIVNQLNSDGFTNIAYVDTYNTLNNSSLCASGASPPFTNCWADTLHPNDTGHSVMASAFPTDRQKLNSIDIPNFTVGRYPTGGYITPEKFWSPSVFDSAQTNFIDTTKWFPGIAWSQNQNGQVFTTNYQPNYGILFAGPSSVGGTSWFALCTTNSYGTGGSSVSLPSTANINPCQFKALGNGTLGFFPDQSVPPLQIQSGGLFFNYGGTGVAGTVNNTTLHWYNSDGRAATNSINYSSSSMTWRGSCWNGSSAGNDDFSLINNTQSGTNPAQVFTLQHTVGCSGASNYVDFSAATSGFKATHFIGAGTPTIVAGTGAGTSPSIAINGDDAAQFVTVLVGTSPAASAAIFTVTFGNAYLGSAPKCIFSPANAATALLAGIYLPNTGSTTSYTLNVGTSALTAAATYSWSMHCIQ